MSQNENVLFLRDLPIGLKAMFKSYCSLRGLTMKAEITRFMRDCIREDADIRDTPKLNDFGRTDEIEFNEEEWGDDA